jgi:hypothetical protein
LASTFVGSANSAALFGAAYRRSVGRQRMSIQDLGSIGELVAALAVLITLVYLSLQVRQGNLLAKSQARQRMVEHAQSELYTQMNDPSVTYAVIKEGALTEEEQAKLSLFLTAFMRQREWEWFQYQDGVIDKDVYRAYHDVIGIFLSSKRTRKWWNSLGRFAFNQSFVEDVDNLLDNTEPNSYLSDIRKWDDA